MGDMQPNNDKKVSTNGMYANKKVAYKCQKRNKWIFIRFRRRRFFPSLGEIVSLFLVAAFLSMKTCIHKHKNRSQKEKELAPKKIKQNKYEGATTVLKI